MPASATCLPLGSPSLPGASEMASWEKIQGWWNEMDENGRGYLMRRITHLLRKEEGVQLTYVQLDGYIDMSWSRLPGGMKTLIKWMYED